MNCMNYDHNKSFGRFKFQSGHRKFYLNNPKGYSRKKINAQTAITSWKSYRWWRWRRTAWTIDSCRFPPLRRRPFSLSMTTLTSDTTRLSSDSGDRTFQPRDFTFYSTVAFIGLFPLEFCFCFPEILINLITWTINFSKCGRRFNFFWNHALIKDFGSPTW